MADLPPQESRPFALGETNVSHPSLMRSKQSQQSIAASEDYYSMSNASSYSGEDIEEARTGTSIRRERIVTPPSRYRTPAQSRDNLTYTSLSRAASREDVLEPEFRKTPMRGAGRRRQQSPSGGMVGEASVAVAAGAAVLKEGGIRRKPVPSVVLENYPWSEDEISPTKAQSSVAKELGREGSPPTPGVDDTPYIRFALDQLTRDEEVRGSRKYRGLGSGQDGNYPYVLPATPGVVPRQPPQPTQVRLVQELPAREVPAHELPAHDYLNFGFPVPGATTALLADDSEKTDQGEWKRLSDPPPRNPARVSDVQRRPSDLRDARSYEQQRQSPDIFRSVSNGDDHEWPLDFIPGILRPLQLGLFLVLVLVFLACLVVCAVWSIVNTGIWGYSGMGDGRYFLFQYLPSITGVILFLWLVQIEVAVYRVAPFIAMSSELPRSRERGVQLPMYPKGFVLPYFGHFSARQPLVGFFMVVAWLQLFTIPLLGSSFNVWQGKKQTWQWIATQGAIWTVIGLYLLLAVAVILLMVWLKAGKRTTGLKWDPRSLADIIVLLERSNALDMRANTEPAKLGYWKSGARPNEVFHTFGISDKAARHYSLEDGRISEKTPIQPPLSRFSTAETAEPSEQRNSRNSRDNMLSPAPESNDGSSHHNTSALPWFLRPSMAALWAIIAIVLLLAFLIVSYLPFTTVGNGFIPMVSAPVNTAGFSRTNFLYSFVPALLAMFCLLFWLEIDYSYRRLQTFAALAKEDGELAERSLLLSYVAELPGVVTATAIANKHWRVAILSFTTLIAATLPILAGGVFWAQFYVQTQHVRISAHMDAFYALSVFCALYALAYLFIFPSKRLRQGCNGLGCSALSFSDIAILVHQSRLLDEVAFHSPPSKIQLVTRLLSAPAGTRLSQHEEAATSKVSLADNVRGLSIARQRALGGVGIMGMPRYYLGRYGARDGRSEYHGIDRIRG